MPLPHQETVRFIVLLAVFVPLPVLTGLTLLLQLRVRRWPLVDSQIIKDHGKFNPRAGRDPSQAVQVSFVFGGQPRTAEILLIHRRDGNKDPGGSAHEYTVGSVIPLHVNPRNPAQAVHETSKLGPLVTGFLLSLALLALALDLWFR